MLPSRVVLDTQMTESDAWKMDRIGSARAGTNPTVLAKMAHSYAVIGDTQFLPGYCVLLVDDPGIDRLSDLPKSQRLEFLESMDTLGQAVESACRATDSAFRRMNYETSATPTLTSTHTCSRVTSGSLRRTSAGRHGSTTPSSSTRRKRLWPPGMTSFVRASLTNSRVST